MSELKHILNKHNFRFEKKYGQNFITDINLLKAIVSDSGIDKDSYVVEIGAGGGTLTKELCRAAKYVYAYEIDKSLKPILEEVLKAETNVSLEFCDILKKDIGEFDDKFPNGYSVVANLPYYITTPVIMMFLENSKKLKALTIMVQKEVALRLCADVGSKDYGSISVAVKFAGGGKITRLVSRNLFYPIPNVDSAIVKINIDRDKYDIADEKLFYKVYRSAFSMRRKTLLNNLSAAFDLDKKLLQDIITSLGKNADVRGETFTAQDFANLSNQLYDYTRKTN